jgi:hypothetical protein
MGKYPIVMLLLAFLSSASFAQSPGGVSTGILLWVKANNGVSTSGTTVTGWTDQTGTKYLYGDGVAATGFHGDQF